MGEQRGLAPLLTVDLAPVTVELNLRESGARFPCKWSSVLEIYSEHMNKLLKDLYDCFCTPPELAATKREIEECHRALIEALGKPERRLVLKIIDAKDHISEDTSLDSFISGFRLAWRLSAELNHYDDERPVRCQAAEKPGARFTLKKEDDEQ